MLLSTVAAPVYIPSKSKQVFPFLHTLTNTYLICFTLAAAHGLRDVPRLQGLNPGHGSESLESYLLGHPDLEDSHSDSCEVPAHCGFHLLFPDG